MSTGNTARRLDPSGGHSQLDALSEAVFGDRASADMHRVFDELVGEARLPDGFPSYVTDDHTPFEFSIVVSGTKRPELRVLAEPWSDDATLSGTASAGERVKELIASRPGVDLERLALVQDLFMPDDPRGPFVIWYAATLSPGAPPRFKVYLNPQVRGPGEAPSLVQAMLERLGMGESFAHVAEAARRGPQRDALRFVSLDLERSAAARVKVYLFHDHASADDLAHVVKQAKHGDERTARAFLKTISGAEGVYAGSKDVGTCLSFTGPGAPDACTIHFPVRAFAGDDQEASNRITAVLQQLEVDGEPYRRTIASFARRALAQGVGLHSYASLGMEAKGHKLNVYLSPELYAVAPPGPVTSPLSAPASRDEDPTAVVREYQHQWPITTHPFLRRMAREPVDLTALTLLLRNFRTAITQEFARRLAHVVARVDETEVRTILAKQLNDELGDGDPKRAHSLLFDRLVSGLDAHAPAGFHDGMLGPGVALGQKLEELYLHRDPYEGLGAALIMEVYGQQIDAFMGGQFRRAAALPASVMEWLDLHEVLEVAHVNESVELASIVPPGRKAAAAARGARELGVAGYRFFDALAQVVRT